MKGAKRWLSACLLAALCLWSVPLWRGSAPADTLPPDPVPREEPPTLCFLAVLTDADAPQGLLLVTLSPTAGVAVCGVPVNTRLVIDRRFVSAKTLAADTDKTPLRQTLFQTLDVAIDKHLILSYDAVRDLQSDFVGGLPLTLETDVPVPFIGGKLILPAGENTLTPAQTIAYWRQAVDPVDRVRRQAQTVAAVLSLWLSPQQQARWDALFAALCNASDTDWRVDSYTTHRATLTAAAQVEKYTTFVIAGETVGENDDRRYELTAPDGAYR